VPCDLTRSRSFSQTYIHKLREKALSDIIIENFLAPAAATPAPPLSAGAGSHSNFMTPSLSHTRDNKDAKASEAQAPTFQIIQPLRAIESLTPAAGLGIWQVHLSGRAEADLRGHRQDGKAFTVILNTIKFVVSLVYGTWCSNKCFDNGFHLQRVEQGLLHTFKP
jgi:hypothetical protein